MLNTKENIDFKKVNTNLKKELSLLGFDISNQSCLNLLSRAIGYQNYNTYLGLNPEIIKIDKISIKNFLKEETCKNRSELDTNVGVRPDAKTEFNRTVKRS